MKLGFLIPTNLKDHSLSFEGAYSNLIRIWNETELLKGYNNYTVLSFITILSYVFNLRDFRPKKDQTKTFREQTNLVELTNL